MLELKHLSYAVHEDGGELGILNDISQIGRASCRERVCTDV